MKSDCKDQHKRLLKRKNTHSVLIWQSRALHLRPSLGLLSLGQLSRRQHGGRFLACSYTRGSILCQRRRQRSPGVHKHRTDPTEPCLLLGSQAQPPALVNFLYMPGCFPNGPCNCQSGWGRFREGHKILTATGRAALLPSGCHQYKGRV